MYDHRVFAVLIAKDKANLASTALRLPHNARWFHKAVGGVADASVLNSREGTPPEDDHHSAAGLSSDGTCAPDRLVISLDDVGPPLAAGIQLGTAKASSHIHLGHRGTKGISAKQCIITVDDNLCVWLHDYTSTHGTAVCYDGQGGGGDAHVEVRRNETWILAGPPGTATSLSGQWDISLHFGKLALKIDFPNHQRPSREYIESLRRFVQRCGEAAVDLAFNRLGLESGAKTQAPSGAQTPGYQPLYVRDRKIGCGAFGQVFKLTRTRDGKPFAGKTFMSLSGTSVDEVDPKWLTAIRREFALMNDNPHPNVVGVHRLDEAPEPMIIMDYYPLGNIAKSNFSGARYITALGQILDGLVHLHSKGVAHRDLKPENILVETSPLFKVAIADFGLAKEMIDTWLKTQCGTPLYMAPEVVLNNRHDLNVDVWSLGVMALQWIHGLPEERPAVKLAQRTQWAKQWAAILTRRVGEVFERDDKLGQLIGKMLMGHQGRWSARSCLRLGLRSGLFVRRPEDGLIVCCDDLDTLSEDEDDEDMLAWS